MHNASNGRALNQIDAAAIRAQKIVGGMVGLRLIRRSSTVPIVRFSFRAYLKRKKKNQQEITNG
jgi:hypothetical protein